MDNPFKSPAVLSLCPGMLGLEIGLELAIGRVRPVAYVEIEAFVIQNLVAQMEKGVLAPAPIWSDVKSFVDVAHLFRGKVHGITGGYPCQPFSNAGKRGGVEDPKHLYPYIERIIDAVRPVWCFFENVPGHLNLGYEGVRESLGRLGYTVEEGIFSAQEVGAPHLRKRLFILAVANTCSISTIGGARTILRKTGQTEGEEQGQDGQWDRTVIADGSEDLANAISGGESQSEGTVQEVRGWVGDCIVENSNSEPMRNEFGRLQGEITPTGSEMADSNSLNGREQQQLESSDGEGTRHEPNRGGEAVADSSDEGSQGRLFTQDFNGPRSSERMPPARGHLWPAKPGEFQYGWEPSRFESRLGYVVDGYNYREDLLRMAGNAVVPQTAEKAFRTLIKKFK